MLFTTLQGLEDPESFPPMVRVQIEQLACCEPAGIGLEMTHWSSRSLTKIVTERRIVPRIAHSTVSLVLKTAELQPHRSRYWKTPTLNAEFRHRASRILWCYENVDKLYSMGVVIICLDEKPNLQALERICPTRLVVPGMIERREFEYIRHGTVNFVAALIVHNGKMRGWCLDNNDSEHLCPVLAGLLDEFKDARKVYLIWDGGPSHRAIKTKEFLRGYGKLVRVFMTPAHASWLNQAELLLRAFSERYLKRGDWKSRQHLVDHLEAGWREYDRLFAHPFTWSWTRRDLSRWLTRHEV